MKTSGCKVRIVLYVSGKAGRGRPGPNSGVNHILREEAQHGFVVMFDMFRLAESVSLTLVNMVFMRSFERGHQRLSLIERDDLVIAALEHHQRIMDLIGVEDR